MFPHPEGFFRSFNITRSHRAERMGEWGVPANCGTIAPFHPPKPETNRGGSGRNTPRTSRREQSPGEAIYGFGVYPRALRSSCRTKYGRRETMARWSFTRTGSRWICWWQESQTTRIRAEGSRTISRYRRREIRWISSSGRAKYSGAEFAGPLNGNLDLSFLHPGEPGTFGHPHTTSLFPIRSINYYHKPCFACLNQANPLL